MRILENADEVTSWCQDVRQASPDQRVRMGAPLVVAMRETNSPEVLSMAEDTLFLIMFGVERDSPEAQQE
ncbi:MAG: hypothetical protein JZU63_05880 [Rhodoferax sp.]|nr:hypothetical protein [Rhodoferax sp.]